MAHDARSKRLLARERGAFDNIIKLSPYDEHTFGINADGWLRTLYAIREAPGAQSPKRIEAAPGAEINADMKR